MGRRVPFPVLAVGAVIVLKSALGAAVLGRYGWQRDELYYAVAARHLSGRGHKFVRVWRSANQAGLGRREAAYP
ncbi:MAG: hypothetical protein ABSB24_14575 [Gaiellaceae bacterium]